MPFWQSEDDRREPVIVLEHLGRKWFKLRDAFVYKVPYTSTRYHVPAGLVTDLASVPWRLWWLVASYGRHTRASLLHDMLVDELEDRVEADRVFFLALEEGRRRRGGSKTRHWLMWLAVSLFGTVRTKSPQTLRCVLAGIIALWVIGLAAVVAGALALAGVSDAEHAVALLGLFTALFVFGWIASLHTAFIHPHLRRWMLPMAFVWGPVVLFPIAAVELAVRAVQLSDAASGGGGPRMIGWRCPHVEPYRLPSVRWDD